MKWLAIAFVFLCGCNGSEPTAIQEPVITGPKVLAIIGDSIVKRWPFPVEITNAGVPGQVTKSMAERFSTDVLSFHPTVVIIEGGINDLANDQYAPISYIQSMANDAAASGAKVVLLSVLPGDIAHPECIYRWNAEIKQLARSYGYTYVNLDPVMRNGDGSIRAEYFKTDLVHPNDAGYEAMWPLVEAAL